jgi:CheY-like chemotaxis protein
VTPKSRFSRLREIPIKATRAAIMARILVIDDDQAVRAAVKAVLDLAGHETVLATDGRDGLDAVESGHFDLLIVDIFMPGMDGIETIMRVQRLRPGLPIIVMSGMSARSASGSLPDFLAMATKLGAVRSLQKPFRPRDLLGAIDACIGLPDRNAATTSAQRATLKGDAPSGT